MREKDVLKILRQNRLDEKILSLRKDDDNNLFVLVTTIVLYITDGAPVDKVLAYLKGDYSVEYKDNGISRYISSISMHHKDSIKTPQRRIPHTGNIVLRYNPPIEIERPKQGENSELNVDDFTGSWDTPIHSGTEGWIAYKGETNFYSLMPLLVKDATSIRLVDADKLKRGNWIPQIAQDFIDTYVRWGGHAFQYTYTEYDDEKIALRYKFDRLDYQDIKRWFHNQAKRIYDLPSKVYRGINYSNEKDFMEQQGLSDIQIGKTFKYKHGMKYPISTSVSRKTAIEFAQTYSLPKGYEIGFGVVLKFSVSDDDVLMDVRNFAHTFSMQSEVVLDGTREYTCQIVNVFRGKKI